MLSTNFANFLGNSINSSLSTAGICAVTSIADPKAAALGSFASSFAGYAFVHVVEDQHESTANLLALGGYLAIKMAAGKTAGQYYDKNFSYFDMCCSYFCVVVTGFIAAQVLGIKNLAL